ncbi:hypothetical protein ABEB36_011974 [Hypothenemus hampei]|uniref:Uncharacterized protein n=1 Tax=Hypothenemus hampei TaxID=57062 RepID=A0ABD1EDZ0_HYPHA
MEEKSFENLISFLEKYDYPHILIMDLDDKKEVFSKENRYNLVTWALNLNKDQQIQANNVTDIIKMLSSYGICKDLVETKNFLNGCLPFQEEMLIFEKLFNAIKVQEHAESIEDVVATRFEDLKPIRLLPKEENNPFFKKFQLIKIPVDYLQKKIEKLTTEAEIPHENIQNVSLISMEDVENIRELLEDFKLVISHVPENITVNRTIPHNGNFDKILETCNDQLQIISRHMNNLKLMGDFQIKGTFSHVSEEYLQMSKNLFNAL